MSWHLDGPLAAYDLESTGVDPDTARIVTAFVGVVTPDAASWSLDLLVNPGVPIPKEASDIHGITDEEAQRNGMPPTDATAKITDGLCRAWQEGAPVIGHNVAYDMTVLDRELGRHWNRNLEIRGPVIDTMVLDKHVDPYRKGKRTLTAVTEHYGVKLGGAHDAAEDAVAAARVAWVIAHRFPEIAGMSLPELHEAQVGWAGEQAASLQAYFRRTKPDAVVDGSWPVRAAAEGVAA
jgi:DNA polymerase-3 subunit epsilon